MRRGGKEVFAQGARRDTAERNGASVGSPVVLPELRHPVKERCEGGGSHVTDMSNQEASHPMRDVGAETSLKPVPKLLHEEGRVKELVGKIEEKAPNLGRFGEDMLTTKPDLLVGMQWETATCQASQITSKGSLAPRNEAKLKEDGPAFDINNTGPLAMSFNENKGWIAESLGPTSRHWKRLAREINKGKTQASEGPTKAKRVGPTPF